MSELFQTVSGLISPTYVSIIIGCSLAFCTAANATRNNVGNALKNWFDRETSVGQSIEYGSIAKQFQWLSLCEVAVRHFLYCFVIHLLVGFPIVFSSATMTHEYRLFFFGANVFLFWLWALPFYGVVVATKDQNLARAPW